MGRAGNSRDSERESCAGSELQKGLWAGNGGERWEAPLNLKDKKSFGKGEGGGERGGGQHSCQGRRLSLPQSFGDLVSGPVWQVPEVDNT